MLRIVLVDDEREMLEQLHEVLTSEGFEVHLAFDGDSGLKLILDKKPDLAIIDIKMPGLSGLDVLRQVKLINPKQRMAMLTGYHDNEMELEAARRGSIVCLKKPISIIDFMQTIRNFTRDL